MEDKRIQVTILELNEECYIYTDLAMTMYASMNPSLLTTMALTFTIL